MSRRRRAAVVPGLDGVVVIDKPTGRTSHQVVAEVSRRLGGVRTGHAGTLDPMATGVLVVCVGEATKLAGVLTSDDKSYRGELELGVETDTLDAEGQVVRERRAEAAGISRDALAAAMAALTGARDQVPPMYSAIKVGGRRLHELARAGAEVDRAPRPVVIRRFDLEGFDPPRAGFAVDCSKGTYVRSLAHELGQVLGVGAHLTALARTASGRFTLAQAIPLDEVTPDSVHPRLIGLADAVAHLPSAVLDHAQADAASHGKPLKWGDLTEAPAPAGPAALIDPEGRLLALVEASGDRLHYRRVFARRS